MKKISILLLGLAALYSCSNDPTASFETNVSNYAAESSHSVSYEDALATAISFMADESISTRTVSSFKVKNHYEYHANKETRSTGEDSIDVRFHVINFSDDAEKNYIHDVINSDESAPHNRLEPNPDYYYVI